MSRHNVRQLAQSFHNPSAPVLPKVRIILSAAMESEVKAELTQAQLDVAPDYLFLENVTDESVSTESQQVDHHNDRRAAEEAEQETFEKLYGGVHTGDKDIHIIDGRQVRAGDHSTLNAIHGLLLGRASAANTAVVLKSEPSEGEVSRVNQQLDALSDALESEGVTVVRDIADLKSWIAG